MEHDSAAPWATPQDVVEECFHMAQNAALGARLQDAACLHFCRARGVDCLRMHHGSVIRHFQKCYFCLGDDLEMELAQAQVRVSRSTPLADLSREAKVAAFGRLQQSE